MSNVSLVAEEEPYARVTVRKVDDAGQVVHPGGTYVCGHCGSESPLLPEDKYDVLHSVTCHCGGRSLLRPDEQVAFYRSIGLEPPAATETPSMVWNGTAYELQGAPSAPVVAAAQTQPSE